MYLPPLQPIANSEIQICGDVEIHPTASIAPGVILKAAPNSRIVIGSDVCLGMGVILNAYNGSIELEAGATLGSGVLIIGSSQIGANACIGTTTTIYNSSIAAMTVVNPGSIIGDHSRAWQTNNKAIDSDIKTPINDQEYTQDNNLNSDNGFADQSAVIEEEIITKISNLASDTNDQKITQQNNSLTDQEVVNDSVNLADSDPWEQPEITNIESQVGVDKKDQNSQISPGVAIGKVYIDQLLVTLFPHKNYSNNSPKKNGK